MEKAKNKEKNCELCKETATNICYDCSFYLCDSCFKFLHNKKANSEHIKEEIDPYISTEINCPEHPKIPKSLFCVEEKSNLYIINICLIALLCSLCYFNYKHNEEHLIIDISDKESFEENNISYKETLSEFEKRFQKAKNLKQNLEEEIEKINKSRDATIEKIKNNYKERYLRLKEEEANLEAELDLKVTEIKDELEKYLTESNDMLLFFERTNKALKNYEKKNNNNDIKTLCYISEIQKVNDKTKYLLEKPLKNIDIEYNPLFKHELDYKYYYFSGIPAPSDIEVNKKEGQVYITWDIGDIRIKNYDKENIKYFIEIEGYKNDIIYETSEKSLLLDKDECKKNIDYKIKICTIMDESCSDWSEIKKFNMNELIEFNNRYLFGSPIFEYKNQKNN